MQVTDRDSIATSEVEQLRARVAQLMPTVRQELSELVAIPSVADSRLFPPEECLRAAEWVADRFAGVGFADVRLVATPDGSSAVIGARPCGDPDAATVLLYAHYDVQPPMDEATWRTPPFRLTEVEGRWHGRGAADCKGNLVMQLAAPTARSGASSAFWPTAGPSPACSLASQPAETPCRPGCTSTPTPAPTPRSHATRRSRA